MCNAAARPCRFPAACALSLHLRCSQTTSIIFSAPAPFFAPPSTCYIPPFIYTYKKFFLYPYLFFLIPLLVNYITSGLNFKNNFIFQKNHFKIFGELCFDEMWGRLTIWCRVANLSCRIFGHNGVAVESQISIMFTTATATRNTDSIVTAVSATTNLSAVSNCS